ncbi:MAG: NHL repeat-containing protein, partial [Gemmatimonadaceae bacterium]
MPNATVPNATVPNATVPNATAAVVGGPPRVRRVWPDAPEIARIAFRGTLASERDIGKKLTGFASLRAKLEGTTETVLAVQRPFDVVSNASNRVYVTDGTRNLVLVFDATARAAKPLGEDGPGRLVLPMGLAIDGNGNVYIADRGAKRVVVFGRDDAFVRTYGNAELLLNPVDVAVDSRAGLVYVADSFQHQVLVFKQSDGALLRRIGRNAGAISSAQRTAPASASHGTRAAVAPDASGHNAPATEPRDVVANRGVGSGEFRYPAF